MTCGGDNGTNGIHVAVSSEDVAFPATLWLPARSHPIEVPVVSVKKLFKMVGKPASYPMYSRYNELL